MLLHANAVAENRAAGVGTGRIDGDDAHGAILPAINAGELIDERALACSGRASQAEDAGFAGMREESLEKIGPSWGAVLDGRDGSCQGAGIAGPKRVD